MKDSVSDFEMYFIAFTLFVVVFMIGFFAGVEWHKQHMIDIRPDCQELSRKWHEMERENGAFGRYDMAMGLGLAADNLDALLKKSRATLVVNF